MSAEHQKEPTAWEELSDQVIHMAPDRRQALWDAIREGGLDDFEDSWRFSLRGQKSREAAYRLLLALADLATEYGSRQDADRFRNVARGIWSANDVPFTCVEESIRDGDGNHPGS